MKVEAGAGKTKEADIALDSLVISATTLLREAVACIDKNQKGIVMVSDSEGRLSGTISDGDVRRAMLAGQSLATPISEILKTKHRSPYPEPVTALAGTEPAELLAIMKSRCIRQLPLLDGAGKIVDLVTMEDLVPSEVLPLQAMIMAGGFGNRLRPLTEEVPKPMLTVGDTPLMELTIRQMRQAGIRRVNIATHYLHEQITRHFGDGTGFGVELNYVTEERPLGTAGALGLMQQPDQPLLVINGDVLTNLDYRSMLRFHQEHSAMLTVGMRQYDLKVPYGVVICDGPDVKEIREKPTINVLVNAGIYLLNPAAYRYIPNGQRFDMTDLIKLLIDNNHRVIGFPVVEYWLDIGHIGDYQQAQADLKDGKLCR